MVNALELVCQRHSDKAGTFYCSKYAAYLCTDCVTCQDPKGYCKFRTSCAIHEIEKHGFSGSHTEHD